jgi:NAD(P)-dependent dehydrogenase (short-subunit alcohol dehydrogenase family)
MTRRLRMATRAVGVYQAYAAPPLKGKVAIVTGGAKGLGAAISEVLALDGADLVVCGRDGPALDRFVGELDASHLERSSAAVICDVRDEPEVDRMVETAISRFGGIDILVNAAGVTGPIETPAHEVSVDDFRSVLDSNVLGTFLPCKKVIPRLIERGAGGRIVNLSGTSGLRGYPNRVAYSASKWAVRGITRTLALELGPHDITVNAICPNTMHGDRMSKIVRVKAERTGRAEDEVYRDFSAQTALGRFVEDVDVASALRYLVSDGARNVTGHDFPVDAGWDV